MNTVREFFEKVALNEYHNIRLKSEKTDCSLCEFNDYKGLDSCGYADDTIKEFATDWNKRIYILWV